MSKKRIIEEVAVGGLSGLVLVVGYIMLRGYLDSASAGDWYSSQEPCWAPDWQSWAHCTWRSGDGVTFRYKDYRKSGAGRQQVMTLAADEFIRRFLLHALPRGFHRIHHYGLLASARRKDHLEHARRLLSVAPSPDTIQGGPAPGSGRARAGAAQKQTSLYQNRPVRFSASAFAI